MSATILRLGGCVASETRAWAAAADLGDNVSVQDLLQQLAADVALDQRRFMARNCLLDADEGRVDPDRYSDYHHDTTLAAAQCFNSWYSAHKEYVYRTVGVGQVVRTPKWDPLAESECPATFLSDPDDAPLVHLPDDTWLIHVESLTTMEWWIKEVTVNSEEAVNQAIARTKGSSVSPEPDMLQAFIGAWLEGRPKAPVFAAVLDDELQEGLERNAKRRGEYIRNRFGLCGLAKGTRLLVFRYQVGEIPRSRHWSQRSLAAPTFLDVADGLAFVPTPRSAGTEPGRAMDLRGGDAPITPVQEVVHPLFPLRAEHVWAVETIESAPPPDLTDARRSHIYYVRELFKEPMYADATDNDLFVNVP